MPLLRPGTPTQSADKRVGCRLTLRVVGCAERTGFVAEHAGVAALVAAGVYQLPLLALVERHVAAGADLYVGVVLFLEELPDSGEICNTDTLCGQ